MRRRRWRIGLAVAVVLAIPAGSRAAPAAVEVPHVFVYSGTAGFRHMSIPHGVEIIEHLATVTGDFTVEFSEDPASLNPDTLSRADVVVWLSTTGPEAPFDAAQRDAYARWLGCGGAHVGIHASTDSYKDWPEWTEVTGAFFAGHPMTPTSLADDLTDEAAGIAEGWGEPEAVFFVEDQEHPATGPWHGVETFSKRDEIYNYDRDPADVIADYHLLLGFDRFTDPIVAAENSDSYPAHMPVSWTGSFREANRIFYTNFGHAVTTWDEPAFQQHLLGGLEWVSAIRPDAECVRGT